MKKGKDAMRSATMEGTMIEKACSDTMDKKDSSRDHGYEVGESHMCFKE